ncbi:hypothetical protein IWX75_002103 [Arthrobacter sp. CAN_A6]|uniref:antitoxin n=1 Tax=Arthrobacter sp. CAN_A6 TaxID=2787721 RepID=UPI0018C93857
MSLFDGLKGKAGGLKEKATALVGSNSGKVKNGIGKAGHFVNGRTGGKYSKHITGVQAKASTLVDNAEKTHKSNGINRDVIRDEGTGTTGPSTPA